MLTLAIDSWGTSRRCSHADLMGMMCVCVVFREGEPDRDLFWDVCGRCGAAAAPRKTCVFFLIEHFPKCSDPMHEPFFGGGGFLARAIITCRAFTAHLHTQLYVSSNGNLHSFALTE